MVKIGGILLCMLVVAMDIAAGILGIQAEIEQNKVKHLRLWIFECKEPSQDAFKLGLAAAGILGIAHVIANLLGGCMCICSQEELQRASPNRQLAVACFLFSWIIFAIGLSMLVIGTLSNNKSRASCGFTHHHFFSIGGILCFVHGLFCVAYYVSATAVFSEEKHGVNLDNPRLASGMTSQNPIESSRTVRLGSRGGDSEMFSASQKEISDEDDSCLVHPRGIAYHLFDEMHLGSWLLSWLQGFPWKEEDKITKGKIWTTKGEDPEVAKKDLIDYLKLLEEELGDKPSFGSETIGYVDVAFAPFLLLVLCL
ncbi:unnamed protein product [Dovyalis caffra]|uniref:Uncharacterized protein n=1 Tax=Dovyalis caffra TaxID=77055 RepID=A0AAV1SMY3_9ROSI|nr:unnamed protein product [Dovyalis caffra]